MPQLFAGTSGWLIHWSPISIREAAQKKSSTIRDALIPQVNFTFRSCQRNDDTELADDTPAHFRFGIRPSSFTHITTQGTEDFVPRFLATIDAGGPGKLDRCCFSFRDLKADAPLPDFSGDPARTLPWH